MASLEDLSGGRVQRACEEWVALLGEPWPVGAAALLMMERWHEECLLTGGLWRTVEALVGVEGGPSTWMRGVSAAEVLVSKYGKAVGGVRRLEDYFVSFKEVTAGEEYIWPSGSSGTLAVAGVPSWVEWGVTGKAVPGRGDIRRSVWHFCIASGGRAVFSLADPGIGTVWLDRRALSSNVGGTGHGRRWVSGAEVSEGCHELTYVEVVEISMPARANFVLPPGGVMCERCEALSSWRSEGRGSARGCERGPVCLMGRLAEAVLAGDRERAEEAIVESGRAELLLAMGSGAWGGDLRRGPAAGVRSCMVDLLFSGILGDGGRHEEAEELLESLAGTECRNTATWHLARIGLALGRGLYGLARAYSREAVESHGGNCDIREAWLESVGPWRWKEEAGRVSLDRFGVECGEIERKLERWELESGRATPKGALWPDGAMENWESLPGWVHRGRAEALAGVPDGLLELEVYRHRARSLAEIVGVSLAAGVREAERQALRIRQVESATGWERAAGGRMAVWGGLLERSSNVEAVIEEFRASGFGSTMGDVVVLDEEVAEVGADGWRSGVATLVRYLATPAAVEAVGEMSVEIGAERLRAGVLKGDGTWVSAVVSQGGEGDGLSFPGLSTGDFLVLQFARETPPDVEVGGCYLTRELVLAGGGTAVFRGRVVLRLSDAEGWTTRATDGIVKRELGDGFVEYGLEKVEATPWEPGAPEEWDGLAVVQSWSKCLTWPNLRDQAAERLMERCNAGLPEDLVKHSGDPLALVAAVVDRVKHEEIDWSAREVSTVLREGVGNRGMVAWCMLSAAGFDAWPVAVSPADTPGFEMWVPSFRRFRGTVIRLRHGGKEHWLSPGRLAMDSEVLPTSWAGRPGLLLKPLSGRLFVEIPEGVKVDRQEAELELELPGGARGRGVLDVRLEGMGGAVLSERMSDGDSEVGDETALGYLRGFLPKGELVGYRFKMEGSAAHLRIEFEVGIGKKGDLRVGLPPGVGRELNSLASRRRPLSFGGLMESDVRVVVRGPEGRGIVVSVGDEEVDSEYGRLSLKVRRSSGEVEVRRLVHARPRLVTASEYRGFAEFVGRVQLRSSMEVRVK